MTSREAKIKNNMTFKNLKSAKISFISFIGVVMYSNSRKENLKETTLFIPRNQLNFLCNSQTMFNLFNTNFV